jgi:hypothetical protein
LRLLLVAAVLGFPIALVFGWMFDVRCPARVKTDIDALRARVEHFAALLELRATADADADQERR